MRKEWIHTAYSLELSQYGQEDGMIIMTEGGRGGPMSPTIQCLVLSCSPNYSNHTS